MNLHNHTIDHGHFHMPHGHQWIELGNKLVHDSRFWAVCALLGLVGLLILLAFTATQGGAPFPERPVAPFPPYYY